MKKIGLLALIILSLPILLFVYQPSWQLGGFGLLLGMIGMTISPLILFVVLFLYVAEKWRR